MPSSIGMQVYEDFIHRYVGTVEEVLTYPAQVSSRSADRRSATRSPCRIFSLWDIDAEKREIYVR